MRSLLILEHPEDLFLLKEKYRDGDLFIGLTPAAAYELERTGLRYKMPNGYYKHDHLFSLYQPFTSGIIDILATLDTVLWDIDERFKKNELKPFFLEIFDFKKAIDTINWFIYILTRIIQQESPEKIVIIGRDSAFMDKNEGLYFSPKDPICLLILLELSKLHKFEVEIIPNKDEINKVFNKNIKTRPFYRFARLKKWIISEIMSIKNYGLAKSKIFSVNCKDLAIIKKELIRSGYIADIYPEEYFERGNGNGSYRHYEKILGAIRKNKKLKELCCFERVNFYLLFEKTVFKFCKRLDVYLNAYEHIYCFMKNKKYDIAMLSFLSGSLSTGRIVADICKKIQVPCICWMHGGYGAYRSFEGYDVSDLLFCDHYFTYGDATNRAIDTFHPASTIGNGNQEKISLHYLVRKIKTHTVGAPFIEREIAHHQRQNNEKKMVVFIMGQLWEHNRYSMGDNCPYTFFQKWEETKTILLQLIRFQDRYEIILKTYPSDRTGAQVLDKFLKDHDGTAIQIVRDRLSLDKLMEKADLTISTWISTTFFQAALTQGDQFLFDDADLTQEAREVVDKCFFFSDNIDGFCHILGDYLEKGEFYRKSKEDFRTKFLDSRNAGHRVGHIANILKQIKENRGF